MRPRSPHESAAHRSGDQHLAVKWIERDARKAMDVKALVCGLPGLAVVGADVDAVPAGEIVIRIVGCRKDKPRCVKGIGGNRADQRVVVQANPSAIARVAAPKAPRLGNPEIPAFPGEEN